MPSAVVSTASTERKPARSSKTLWFNAFFAGLAAAEEHLGLLQPHLPVNVYAVIAFTLAVGNTVLRVFFTTQALRLPTR